MMDVGKMLFPHHVVTPHFTQEIFSCLSMASTDGTDASGWTYHFSGIFSEFTPVALALPDDGWKIRINVVLKDVIALLRGVVPVLRRERLAFKVLADPTLYRIAFSKQIAAESAGKFLTIYVPSAEKMRRIIRELAAVIENLAVNPCAPPISDTPFSKGVSYRFGSFTDSAWVRGRDGHVEDCREFFRLPPGIVDPFTNAVGASDDDGTDEPVQIGNYEITSVLHRTYASAVYFGTRKDGLEIVLKEARPDAYVREKGLATEHLQNEYQILREISASGCSEICPTAIEMFEIERHLFITMTRLRAVSLYEWRQQNRMPADHLRIGKKIAEILDRLHSNLSIAWGDIHASNLLVDLVDDSENRVYLIDPEFATHTRNFANDIEMFGRLLLWLVFNVDTLFEPDCYPDFFLQKMDRKSDYSPAYINAVRSALSGRIKSVSSIFPN